MLPLQPFLSQAEGPACHRKKDLLDKATKEAEHREALRDMGARIQSLAEAVSNGEASRTRWAERLEASERELAAVREALRLTAARRASLIDVCTTLANPGKGGVSALLTLAMQLNPELQPSIEKWAAEGRAAEELAAASKSAQAAGPAPLTDAPAPAAAAATAASSSDMGHAFASASASFSAIVTAPSPAAAGAAPDESGKLPSGVTVTLPTGEDAVGPDQEWTGTQLECLMYRTLWVSESIKTLRGQYHPSGRERIGREESGNGPHAALYARASRWARTLAAECEDGVRGQCAEIARIRARLRDAAAVDLGGEITGHAMEVVRRRIEAAAHAAREAASLLLLRELEEEEAEAAAQAANKQQGASQNGREGAGKGAKDKAAGSAKGVKEKAAAGKQADKSGKGKEVSSPSCGCAFACLFVHNHLVEKRVSGLCICKVLCAWQEQAQAQAAPTQFSVGNPCF